jgi:predicted DNA-binding mobile mystery protein A
MKTSKNKANTQRRILDQKIKLLESLSNIANPRSGWLKAIRGALGLSARRLGSRLNVDMSAVLQMEQREMKGTITLDLLARAAKAMDCKLVYAIVPDFKYSSLDAILDERAMMLARTLAKDVSHSMKLESQGVSDDDTEAQIQRIAQELKAKLDLRLWEQ